MVKRKKIIMIMMVTAIAVISITAASAKKASAEETSVTGFDPAAEKLVEMDGKRYGLDSAGNRVEAVFYSYDECYHLIDPGKYSKVYNELGDLIFYEKYEFDGTKKMNKSTVYDNRSADTIRYLKITARRTIVKGYSVNLICNANRWNERETGTYNQSDIVTLTDKAVWSSADPRIATVDANGVVTGHEMGEVDITATYAGRTATGRITVIENGYEWNPQIRHSKQKIKTKYHLYINDNGNMVLNIIVFNDTKKKQKYEIGKAIYMKVGNSKYKLPKLARKKITIKTHKSKTLTVVIKKSAFKGKLKSNGGNLRQCRAIIYYQIKNAGVECNKEEPISG